MHLTCLEYSIAIAASDLSDGKKENSSESPWKQREKRGGQGVTCFSGLHHCPFAMLYMLRCMATSMNYNAQ